VVNLTTVSLTLNSGSILVILKSVRAASHDQIT